MIKVLIVDDEKPICDLIDLNLSAAGYQCTSVQDGLAALDLIEKERFDLILLDIMLPGADGYDIMEYIRPLGIPVIFVTAKHEVKNRVKGLKLGADDYLVNEQGYIVSSLQPMGDYDNLYALRGINCSDIDGDGLKDMVVLARYSYEGESGEMVVQTDYSVYYQRTGGFSADEDIKNFYRCEEDDTMEALIKKVREYWGWQVEND